MGTSSVVAGFANETSRYWVSAALIGVGGDSHYAGHIYAISGVLTAVPEPASGWLLAAAAICFGRGVFAARGLMGSRLRRTHRRFYWSMTDDSSPVGDVK